MTYEDNGLDQARDATKRAEDALAEVSAQRPEVRRIRDKAIWLHEANSFAALTTQAMATRGGS